MYKTPLLLVGAGGHARSAIDVIEREGRFFIAGLVGMPQEVNSSILGYDVLGTDDDLQRLSCDFTYALITVGFIKTLELRMILYRTISDLGYKQPTIVSPMAYVSRHAQIGSGSIVMHGAVINAEASIGKNCIVNSSALIEHDATIANHCHISTGAIVNGGAQVGEGSFVGSGSVLKEGVSIGRYCLVGMGVRVRRDHKDGERMLKDD